MKKRLVTAVLMLTLALSLVACGGGNAGDTEKNNTQNSQQDDAQADKDTEEESETPAVVYTIKVVDEANAPVANVMVQLCKDTCVPKMTDANGVAEFSVEEIADGYKANVTKAPEGYTYEDGDVYFEDGATEVVLVLKAAQ